MRDQLALAFALSPELVTALGAALAFLTGAIFVGAVNLYNAKTNRMKIVAETQKAMEPIQKTLNDMVPTLGKIDTHVNSEKTRDQGIIAAQKREIELLHDTVDDMRKAAALLAQAKAAHDVAAVAAQAAVAGATTPVVIKGDRRKDDPPKGD